MRLCEVCGTKEEMDGRETEVMEHVILHVCESCREDRKMNPIENWVF
ncbi:hypothetical protein [Bacillus sp. T33-2]|nr:hypothetical protein [Bacillus sp. T33-2]